MFTMDIGEAPRAASGAVNEDEAGHAKLEDMVTSKPSHSHSHIYATII